MSENEMSSPIGLQPRDGRVQPLLVVLKSVDDAEFLINNAKCMRRPTAHTSRSSVYINPDLTKVEALTAYHRCTEIRLRKLPYNQLTAFQVQEMYDHLD